jgi:hypothetical protein
VRVLRAARLLDQEVPGAREQAELGRGLRGEAQREALETIIGVPGHVVLAVLPEERVALLAEHEGRRADLDRQLQLQPSLVQLEAVAVEVDALAE